MTEQEGKSCRDNIRIHGVSEGTEEKSTSVISLVGTSLKENLDILY